jgi:hypothetical protein
MEVVATRNVSKMKGTATMSDTKENITARNTGNAAGNGETTAAETVAPLESTSSPLMAAKLEVNAAIDGLLSGPYSRVGVARLRDAIDLLRAAIPSRPPARGRRA